MASLAGKADSTLVAAAFREGMSNVPLDLGDVYKQREKNIRDFSTGVSELMDSIYKDENAALDILSENSGILEDQMNTEGSLNWEAHTLEHEKTVRDFKDRLMAIKPIGKENKAKRDEVMKEVNKYFNTMSNQQETIPLLLNSATNKTLLRDIGDDRTKLFEAVIQDIRDNTEITNPTYKNGDMVYTLGDKSMTWSEIKRGLTINDPSYVADYHKNNFNSLALQSQKRKGNMTKNDIALWSNNAVKDIKSWDHVRMLENEPLGNNPYTFRELLYGQAKDAITGEVDTKALEELYIALDEIGGVDMNDSGGLPDNIDAGMYRDPKNGEKLINELKKDLGKYSGLMVNVFGKTIVQDVWEQGAELRKAQTTGGVGRSGIGKGGAHLLPSGAQVSDATFQRDFAPYVNFLNNPTEGQEMQSPVEKLKVKYQGGQFNIFDNKKGKYVPVGNAKETAEYDGLMNYISGPKKVIGGGSAKNYNDIIDINFIKMTEENAETYLKENLPEGFTFNQYGIGDAIKVMYGDKSIKINLQPNTTSGENKNIKKLQDFINEVLGGNTGTGKYD